MNIVNIPDPHNKDSRVIGYRIEKGDEAYGEYGLSEPCTWFNKLITSGIKNHDGQKLLIQYVLNTDSGLSENTRTILESLIS